jgi:hypothetical protein
MNPRTHTIASLLAASLAVSATSRAAQPVPATDARETVWSAYVASTFEDAGHECECEYRLPDESRIDIYQKHRQGGCIAWEVERVAKWESAIGQSLYYQLMTDAAGGGIVLIVLGEPGDKLDILRCKLVCQKAGLKLLTVDARGVVR